MSHTACKVCFMEWGQNQLSLQDQMLAFYNSANHGYIEFMRLYIISMFLQYKSYHFHITFI